MSNDVGYIKSESYENTDKINIENIEQEYVSTREKRKIIIRPKTKLDEELEDIKEEDYFPIMSRIKHELKEKKNKKGSKENSYDDEYKFKKGKERDKSKIPFIKFSKNKLTSNRLNTLYSLEPFYTDFISNSEKKGEENLKIISEGYKEENFKENNIIYRYGDEADKFFVIKEGKISLFFPFTEVMNMNIDEFYIYLLRLRRYNEIEMINDVLLINQGKFMIDFDEGFNFDNYIIKLYNTSLKLRFDSDFLYKDKKKKKIHKIKVNKNKSLSVQNNKNRKINLNINKKSNIYKIKLNSSRSRISEESNEFDDNKLKIFYDREIKELVIRIEEEIIETMKWIMPDKLYEIYEKIEDDKKIKKLIRIPDELIQKYKQYNSNIINNKDYSKRILPPKINNKKLEKREIIIMKYLYISTLFKGFYFGDFCSDSLTLFCPKYLINAKNSRIPLKMHEFYLFRNMTVISNSNSTCLLSFNKKLFFANISKFIENKTYPKKKFLLNHPLFANTDNKNLIKTYSVCFQEKSIKEGEFLIREDEELNESNINLYFVIKGELQAFCKKNIFQIDEIVKLLGREDNIKDTFPKELKGLLGTKYFNDLASKVLNIKLNYFTKNDIIGLAESFINDKYFNNIICSNNNTKIYCVDLRIIKLLVDSDDIILKNKNIIIYHKYRILTDILLNQRKIYFNSFFNLEKHNVDNNILIKENNDNNNNEDMKNNSRELIGDNFNNDLINKEKIDYANIRTIQKLNEVRSSSFEENMNQIQVNPLSIKKTKIIKNKEDINDEKNKIVKNLGDIDKLLVNLNYNYTLTDKRLERTQEFRKNYLIKMEKINAEKKAREERRKKIKLENEKCLRKSQSNFNVKVFQKSISIYKNVFRELPLLPNKDNFIKLNGQYKLIIPYKESKLKKSNSTNNINPLAYDDFNRYYNTSQYFRFKNLNNTKNEKNFFEEKKYEPRKDYFEYNIELKSDVKFKNKKDNKLMRNNLLTRKLRNIYKGKLDRILYKRK